MSNATDIIRRNEQLTTAKANNISAWVDLTNLCWPRRSWIDSPRSQGEPLRLRRLYDCTAVLAARESASGFHTNLTNPAGEWFSLRTRDDRYMKSYQVNAWFKQVEKAIYSTLYGTNFYREMLEFYMYDLILGTAVMLIERDERMKVRFTVIPLEQVNIEENAFGRIDKVYRNFKYNTIQAYGRWGEAAGEEVVKAYQDKNFDKQFEFIHYVGPRDVRDENKWDGKNKRFESLWINKKEKKVVDEGGYDDMPYVVSRFYHDTVDPFGFSPAMDIIAEVRGVNWKKRNIERAESKMVDPALFGPSDGFDEPINANPGAWNVYDRTRVNVGMVQPLPQGGRIDISEQLRRVDIEVIEKAFFLPLFRGLSNTTKQMTATEVQRRIAESMAILGPVVGGLTDEAISPCILRVFNILYQDWCLPAWQRNMPGLFDPPPESIRGQEMDIQYLSPLARAQKEFQANSIMAFMGDVSQIAAVKPEVLDIINPDKAADLLADVRGIDKTILYDEKQREQIRQVKLQQAMQQRQLQIAQQGAQAMKDGTNADKNMAQAEAVR